jgi:hypothetical protein
MATIFLILLYSFYTIYYIFVYFLSFLCSFFSCYGDLLVWQKCSHSPCDEVAMLSYVAGGKIMVVLPFFFLGETFLFWAGARVYVSQGLLDSKLLCGDKGERKDNVNIGQREPAPTSRMDGWHVDREILFHCFPLL